MLFLLSVPLPPLPPLPPRLVMEFIKQNVAPCVENNQALGEGCPGLLRLDVTGCDAVTDIGLSWMSNGCPALKYLDIAGCIKARLL